MVPRSNSARAVARNMALTKFLPAIVSALWLATGCAGAETTESRSHPLDPLNEQEHAEVVRVLEASPHADRIGLYPIITLDEPPKDVVLKWKPGEPIARRAFVIVKDGPRTWKRWSTSPTAR